MDKDTEMLDDLIAEYESYFREEIKKELNEGRLTQESYLQFLPVINRCIDLFAWRSVMEILKSIEKT